MNTYLNSENEFICEEYNNLRRMVLKILRLTRKEKMEIFEEEKALLLKSEVDNHDVLINGTIDKLVRKNLISNAMATSLMNDSTIAIHIAHDLIEVSFILKKQEKAYSDIATDDEEIKSSSITA